MKGSSKVLVVDDEQNAVKVLAAILADAGYRVLEARDVESAIKTMSTEDLDAIITDLKMPGKDGTQLLDYIKENLPEIPVIFLTAYGTVESAVHTITNGAFYYFIKPPDYQKLKVILTRAVEQRRLKRELTVLKKRLSSSGDGLRIVGTTPAMFRIFETINAVKNSSSSVLITGETGTGKELIARSLHYSSSRKDRPFITVNCAAIPRELLESELFGYDKGAFTGAVSSRVGRFEEALGGTVFLDEIGELEPSLQAKLLRVLQEREIERLGSNRKIKVDFRLVCSTNRELKSEVRDGRFREDLFYRINVVEIQMPPLRERSQDIPLLAAEFVKEFCLRENKTLLISDEVMGIFRNHSWPGNIRQLRNVIERAVVLAKGQNITTRELPRDLRAHRRRPARTLDPARTLKAMEAEAIRDALERSGGNKSKAARMLGISRKAFYKKLKGENVAVGNSFS
jgi:DNA-binding NtrC family response regulator